MKPLIVFDFDGTIVDSVDCIVDVINEVAVEDGYSERASRELFRKQSVQKVMRSLGIPFWKVPGYVKRCRLAYGERLGRLQAHPGLKQVLKGLRARADLAVVSSNTQHNISRVLERLGLSELFDGIEEAGAFDKHKLLKKHRKNDREVLYVGDEVRDVLAAKRAKVHSLAVTWGLAGTEQLLRARPDMIAATPQEFKTLASAWIDERTP